MKKKLLTILLSVFMVMTSFITSVLAEDYQTISDIYDVPDMPEIDEMHEQNHEFPDNAWININNDGGRLVNSNLGFKLISNDFLKSFSINSDLTLTKSGNNYICTNNDPYFTLEFNFSGDDFLNIIVDGFTNDNAVLNGVYISPNVSGITTLALDMPILNDFVVPSGAWANKNADGIYLAKNNDGNIHFFKSDFSNYIDISGALVRVDANTYKKADEPITYTLSNNKLVSVTVSDTATGDLEPFKGEYTAPSANVTIASILATLSGNFPSSDDSIPINAWQNEDNVELKAYMSNGELKIGNSSLELSKIASKVNNQKYSCDDIEFNLDQNGKLISIVMRMSLKYDNGIYAAPKTIAEILATVPGDFPTSTSNAWLNEKGTFMYVDSNYLLYYLHTTNVADQLTKSGSDYTIAVDQEKTLTFKMNDGVLEKVIVEGATDNYSNGTYMPQGVDYDVTDGKQITIDINKGENVTFTSKADFSRFKEVKVDGVTINSSNYTVVSGSTKVTVKASYLNTLSAGNHTIEIVSNNGSASTTFTIVKNDTPSPSSDPTPKYKVPNTGVDGTYSNNHSLLKLSSLSLLAIGTYMAIKKKKDN